jgi:hypothetical protein
MLVQRSSSSKNTPVGSVVVPIDILASVTAHSHKRAVSEIAARFLDLDFRRHPGADPARSRCDSDTDERKRTLIDDLPFADDC